MQGARRQPGLEPVAEAPSVRKDEVFRATKTGLARLQTSRLRSGGKHHRVDELPYSRIGSLSYEERVITRGSKPLATVGIVLLVAALGLPALTSMVSIMPVPLQGSRIASLTNSISLPNLAGIAVGVGLVASKFPRRTREGWWQVKGQDLTPEDQRGWQIAGDEKGTDELVLAVREGIARSATPNMSRKP